MTHHGGFSLTVLGCAGSSYDAALGIACSSYLLESDDSGLLLDCGFGSFASVNALARVVRLDAIFVSHAHSDHVADLQRFCESPLWRDSPLVLAERSTVESLTVERGLAARIHFVGDAETVGVGGFEATFSVTRHQIPTLGVRVVAGGRSVVYSADTGPGWMFPPSFRRANLAIIECTWLERSEASTPYHLDAREAAELANELAAHATLLTHVPPGDDGPSRLELVQCSGVSSDVSLAAVGKTMAI